MKKLLTVLVLLSAGFAFSAFAGPVNVNTADAAEIANELTGIGQVKAEAIVAYREAHGSFESLDGLEEVKGIGDKTIEKNREDILLSNSEK